MRMIGLIVAMIFAATVAAAGDCGVIPGNPSNHNNGGLSNPNAPGGACTKSCRYQPSYENPDQCSHGSTVPFRNGQTSKQTRLTNPYLNALCKCETPLISKTIGNSGYFFCGENNDEWVYVGYPITMNLMAWQWSMSFKYSPEYKCE